MPINSNLQQNHVEVDTIEYNSFDVKDNAESKNNSKILSRESNSCLEVSNDISGLKSGSWEFAASSCEEKSRRKICRVEGQALSTSQDDVRLQPVQLTKHDSRPCQLFTFCSPSGESGCILM